MTDKLFDDFFKEKLEHHDSGAPMQVWEKVRRELHEKDDDKGIAWWKDPRWFIVLLLVIGGGTALIGNYNGWFKKPATTAQKQNPIDNNKTSDIASNEKNKPVVNKNDESITNPEENKSTETVNKTVPVSATNDNNLNNTSSFASDNKIKTNREGRDYRRSVKVQQLLGNTFPLKFLPGKENPTQSTTINNNIADENNSSLSLAAGTNKLQKNFLETQKFTALLPGGLRCLSSCPTIGPPRRNDLYVEVYGSPDNVTRSLSGTSFTPANYIDKRNEAEKSKIGFSAGIRLAKNLGERTVLKTGINYSQINETLKYINEKDIRIVTVITIRTVTSGGQTITISDTTTVTQVGTTYTTFNNRYRTIDIPLIFSYELGDPRKLAVGINAGAIININSSYKGKILDTNLNPVSINTNNTLGVNAWRKNIGLGLYASLSFYKRLNSWSHLFFEPYTRINLKPVNVSETVVKQKYNTTGLQVGIRYNLFHKRQRYFE